MRLRVSALPDFADLPGPPWPQIGARLCRRLNQLVESVSTVDAPQGLNYPANIRLEPKDQPILLAAIQSQGDYLITGDVRHTSSTSTERRSKACWC